MKNTLFIFLLSTGFALSQTLEKKDLLLSVGGGSSSAVVGVLEYAITNKITLGPIAGIYRKNYDYGTYSTKYRYTSIGAVGNYHFYTKESFDVYGGVLLGYSTASIESNNLDPFKDNNTLFGLHLGARYYLSNHFAFGLETGTSFSLFQARLTYKF